MRQLYSLDSLGSISKSIHIKRHTSDILSEVCQNYSDTCLILKESGFKMDLAILDKQMKEYCEQHMDRSDFRLICRLKLILYDEGLRKLYF